MKNGFKIKIYQKAKLSSYKKNWKKVFDIIELTLSFKNHISRIPIIFGNKSMDIINKALTDKIPPLVFINLEPITGENVFHWIIVTGLERETIYVNDPDISKSSKKDFPIDIITFQKAIATDQFNNVTFPFSIFSFPPAILLIYK